MGVSGILCSDGSRTSVCSGRTLLFFVLENLVVLEQCTTSSDRRARTAGHWIPETPAPLLPLPNLLKLLNKCELFVFSSLFSHFYVMLNQICFFTWIECLYMQTVCWNYGKDLRHIPLCTKGMHELWKGDVVYAE